MEIPQIPPMLVEAIRCRGALTWQQAQPPHAPDQSGEAVRLLVEPPSMIRILSGNQEVAIRMLKLAASHQLRARRVHDARNAAAAIVTGEGSAWRSL